MSACFWSFSRQSFSRVSAEFQPTDFPRAGQTGVLISTATSGADPEGQTAVSISRASSGADPEGQTGVSIITATSGADPEGQSALTANPDSGYNTIAHHGWLKPAKCWAKLIHVYADPLFSSKVWPTGDFQIKLGPRGLRTYF